MTNVRIEPSGRLVDTDVTYLLFHILFQKVIQLDALCFIDISCLIWAHTVHCGNPVTVLTAVESRQRPMNGAMDGSLRMLGVARGGN